MSQEPEISVEDLTRCTEVLESVVSNDLLLSSLTEEQRIRLFIAAGKVVYPDRIQVRRRQKALRKQRLKSVDASDRAVRAATAMRTLRRESVFTPPPRSIMPPEPIGELKRPRDCYVCKKTFSQVHFFYDSMCPPCAALNYEKRFQTASLEGRVAIITGARLKIGYQCALLMLRAGARVIVTTRFPHDAAMRFAREADFPVWGPHLQVYGLDLRYSPSVEAFTQLMERTLDRLDILINNAAQTVRRPPGFYAHMTELEAKPLQALPEAVHPVLQGHATLRLMDPDNTGDTQQITDLTSTHFPAGRLDADLQQVDLRKMNSWRMTLADVPPGEMLEVQLVNAVAPFILCSKLKPLMLRQRTNEKHIVNVSAMEGKFNRHTKTDKHPHTNMAKAALNMMTLTSARDYAASGIFMNAVDTGWVTDEDPIEFSARKQQEHDFQPPLDIVDGAARVCDPFFSGLITGKHSWGNFLKDYFPTEW